MASNPTKGYRPIALSDWRFYLQSLVGRVEELEADQTSHPAVGGKELAKWIGDYVNDLESCLKKANDAILKNTTQPRADERGLNNVDILNNVVSKLGAVSDFVKRIGDDSYVLEKETPLGLHLIIDECIDTLVKIGEAL